MQSLELALVLVLALPGLASAQASRPVVPEMPAQAPSSSGPAAAGERPGSGMVRVPPVTDPKSLATPPKDIDPAMDDATGRIDRKNKEKGAPKPAAPGKGTSNDKSIQDYK